MKKFLLVTPQLPEHMLAVYKYEPADNGLLEYGPTHFPAIPLINAHIDSGDEIRILTVTYDIPECHRNLQVLENEIATVCSKNGTSYSLESIDVPFDDSIQAILNVYQELIARVDDGDELYADITYGSKPMPIVLTMALQYAYRTKSNASIECVVYGQVSHHKTPKEARIYDVTALVQLDEIVRLMADGRISDPKSIIDLIIGK